MRPPQQGASFSRDVNSSVAGHALEVLYRSGLPRPPSLRTFRVLTSSIGVAATMGSVATMLTVIQPSAAPSIVLFGVALPLLVAVCVSRARRRREVVWGGVLANTVGTAVFSTVAVVLTERSDGLALPRLDLPLLVGGALGLIALAPSALLLGPIGAATSPSRGAATDTLADDFAARIVTRLGIWLALAAAGTIVAAALVPDVPRQRMALAVLPAIGGLLCGIAIAVHGRLHEVGTRRWLARVAAGDVPRVRIRAKDATASLAVLPPVLTHAACDGVLEVDADAGGAHPFRHRSSTPVRRAPLPL